MATLKEAIGIAQKEPQSERSQKLKAAIISGKMDSIAANEGVDLSSFKQKVATKEGKGPAAQILSALAPNLMKTGSQLAAGAKEFVGQSANAFANLTPEERAAKEKEMEFEKKKEEYTDAPEGGIHDILSIPGKMIAGGIKGAQEGYKSGQENRAAFDEAAKTGKTTSNLEGIVSGAREVLDPIAGAIGGAAAPIVEPVIEKGGAALSAITPDFIENPTKEKMTSMAKGASEWFGGLDPEMQRSLKNYGGFLMDLVDIGTAAGGGALVKKGGKELAEQVVKGGEKLAQTELVKTGGQMVDDASQAVVKAAEGITDVVKPEIQAVKDIAQGAVNKSKEFLGLKTADEKIQALINPKMIKGEKMQAIKEGRVTEGKKGLLGGKKPDEVLPSEDVIKSSQTIKKLIPEADKKTQFELYNSMVDKTNEIATGLRGDLEGLGVSRSYIKKTKDEWRKAAKQQSDSPIFAEHAAAGKKMQQRFEKLLSDLEKKKSLNFADIWDARIELDDLTSKAAKNATEMSSTLLQLEKDLWLQNRTFLNSLLKQESGKLAEGVKSGFSDMSDMYNSMQNILSNADVDIKGKENALKKVLKYYALPAGIGGAAVSAF